MTAADGDGDRAFDPVALEILSARLVGLLDEAASALRRAAFSTIVRESEDYGVVLTDPRGLAVAETTMGTPGFLGILPRLVRTLLAERPAASWRAGDVVATNDPWLLAGHLPDMGLVSPVFRADTLAGFVATCAHLPDIGGAIVGADARELFEEGLLVPTTLLVEEGRLDESLLRLLRANVRLPDEVVGDLFAQLAGHHVLARRLVAVMDDAGLAGLEALCDALQDRGDRAMRRAIAALPDGTWRAETVADGYEDSPIRIACAVTVAGDALTVDYAGSAPQVERGLNCVLGFATAWTQYALKCSLDPATPRNEGSMRAVRVTAPEGSILNPRFPAPCGGRQLVAHLTAGVVHATLAGAVPERVLAESGTSPSCRVVFSGEGGDGRRFVTMLFANGGMGAGAHRDGYAATPYPTMTGAGSVEALEASSPLLLWRKELRPDSGGPGRRRGGLGQDIEIEVPVPGPVRLSIMSDRRDHPPSGLARGGPGAPVEIALSGGGRPHPKGRSVMRPGERLLVRFPGGGGFGPADRREAAAIAADLADGYVTPEGAARDYGWRDE